MNCIKCKEPTSISKLCSRHVYCNNCVSNLKSCEFCRIVSNCYNCPNNSLNPICLIGQCQHKLCSECLKAISISKNYTCPLCSKPIVLNKLQAYLKYFVKNLNVEEVLCKNCGKKGSFQHRQYYDCKNCKVLGCIKHNQAMKICRCRCLDCYRQTKLDLYGRIVDCRCITSDTYIKQKSPSPYRPTSSRELMPKYPYPSTTNGIKERQKGKSPIIPLAPANQKDISANKRENKVQLKPVKGQNIFLPVPQPQYHNQKVLKPQTAQDLRSPRNKSPIPPVRPLSPALPLNPLNTIQKQIKPKQTLQLPSPSPLSKPVYPRYITQPNQDKKQKELQRPSKDVANQWRCRICESVLQSKVRKQLICNYCSMMCFVPKK